MCYLAARSRVSPGAQQKPNSRPKGRVVLVKVVGRELCEATEFATTLPSDTQAVYAIIVSIGERDASAVNFAIH